MADGKSSSAYNARFCNSALYARRAHNAREFFCRCMRSKMWLMANIIKLSAYRRVTDAISRQKEISSCCI